MNILDKRTPEQEHKHHRYLGNFVPWNVLVLWVLFALFVIFYLLAYLFPVMKSELISPP